MKYFLVMFFAVTATFAQTKVPNLAELKVAAERGDAQAQFDYGSAISALNAKESFAMKLKSANQGYGPAEDAIGDYYESVEAADRSQLDRLAARYTSRAAFKGIASAQARLSRFYEGGQGVPKNPTLAYGWLALALKTAGGPTSVGGSVYRELLDQLIVKTPSAMIVAGQEFADAFRPPASDFNPVEADILITQLKITAFYQAAGKAGVLVNQTRFTEGETKAVMVDGTPLELTCVALAPKSARMRMKSYEFTLKSK